MSKWSREITVQLIEKIIVLNIWDVSSKEYKDINKRKYIYTAIGAELNFSAKEIETKWHIVKNQYSRELAKVMSCNKSGAATEDRHPPPPREPRNQMNHLLCKMYYVKRMTQTKILEMEYQSLSSTSFNLQPFQTARKNKNYITPTFKLWLSR